MPRVLVQIGYDDTGVCVMDWSKLQDASGDGRGRPATVDPTLSGILAGESVVFGPYKSKGSAKTSMSGYSDRASARGLVFAGPRSDGVSFYFQATRPE
jgi:hypothetical protein